MKIRDIAKQEGIKPKSLQTRIKRYNAAEGTAYKYGLNDTLSAELYEAFGFGATAQVKEEKPLEALKTPSPKPKKKKTTNKEPKNMKKTNTSGGALLNSLPYLALPMLMLPLAYGVYSFASQFVPSYVAIGEAFALEFTYVGLAALRGLSPNQVHRAKKIAYWAVTVSITYNIIAAGIHQNADLFAGLEGTLYYEGDQLKGLGGFFVFWSLAIIHGLPIGVVSFKIAELLLHQQTIINDERKN
jgi:hypothetical protein